MRILLLAFFMLSLCHCGTVLKQSDTTCSQIDWYERGRGDGAQGLGLEMLHEVRKSCGDTFTSDNETIYINGRNAGLVDYCAPATGFEMGRMGVTYTYVCPSTMEPAFLSEYEKGKKARELERENDKLESRMDAIAQRLNVAQSDGEKRDLRFELSTIKRLRAQNEKELMSISK